MTSSCNHSSSEIPVASAPAREQAAAMFRALGDPARLLLMECLMEGERCVGDLAVFFGQEVSTISQRLKVLRNERLIERRREGKHIFYSLADGHVTDLIRSALEHAQHSL